jgi:intein/homing endonuclease
MTQPLQSQSLEELRARQRTIHNDLKRRQWALDPVLWARERLKVNLWSRQAQIMEAVRDHRHVAVRSSFDTGKCVEENERLILSDGRVVKAADLVGRYFSVLSYLEDGTQQPELAWATDNGVREVVRVVTDEGREIVRTLNHPLFKGTRKAALGGKHPKVRSVGWTPAGKLVKGDLVLVPEEIKCKASRSIPEDHIKLMGYLIGDGGTTVNIVFTQKDGPAKIEFTEIIERLGCSARRCNEFSLSITTGESNRFTKGANPVLNLARDWGLLGCKSKHKQLPSVAWELPDSQLALLINRIFACDGWAYLRKPSTRTHQNGQIGISLASKALISDIEIALLRLGIHGRVRQRTMKLGAKRFPAWEWSTTVPESIQRFAEVVGIFGKEERLGEVVTWAKSIERSKNRTWWRHRECPAGYRWLRVKSVERVGRKKTVTISVANSHTFISTFVEHNSFVSAVISCWWIDTHPPGEALVVSSATTEAQVKAILWHEIGSLHARAQLPGRLNQTEWWINVNGVEKMVGIGRKPADTNAVAFQGMHRKFVLVILDEAAGIPISLFDAAEGLLTNQYCRLLAIGNPEDSLSEFAAISKPGSGWHSIKISAFDTPAFTGEPVSQDLLDVLVSRTWVEERAKRWGTDSPKYISKVLGEFPEVSDDCLILPSWVLAAQERTLPITPPFELGVDVGAGGDSNIICHRQGSVARIIHSSRLVDTMRACGNLVDALRKTRATLAKVDEIGVGKGMTDRAKELGHNVIGINVGMAADRRTPRKGKREIDEHDDSEQFINRRAQGYWALRELFQCGDIDIDPADEDLAAQLVDIKYSRLSNGKIQIESKKEMKARGRESPDRADALMLAFMPSVVKKKASATWGSGRLAGRR